MSSLLVPVVKISQIEKHPNADTLSVANFEGMGWNCIIKNGDFEVGDLAIYIPIDSVVPDSLIEEYNLSYLKNGGRITTVKLRGFASQGLLLNLKGKDFKLGENVAEKLGVIKWQPPEPKFQQNSPGVPKNRKKNPFFDKYTDIENIKNYATVFVPGDLVVVREKIHGSNWRAATLVRDVKTLWDKIKLFFKGKYEFVYGSHNVQLGVDCYGNDIYGKIAKKYNMMKNIPQDYELFGEVYGKGVQDLEYGMNDIDFVAFGLKHKGQYVTDAEMEKFCTERGIPVAPLVYRGEYYDGLLADFTDGKSLLCPTQIREGIVITDQNETNDRKVGRKILKSVSVDYLMRKNGTEYH